MQASSANSSFFLRNMGPTLVVLSYFSQTKVSQLLARLSKRGQTFLEKRKQDILQMCISSAFDAKMTELPPIRHLDQDIPICKVLHLSGSIFFVIHVNGLVVKVDFETPDAEEPLDSFQIPCESDERLSILTDADILRGNEEHLLFAFMNRTVAFLNFKTKEFYSETQFLEFSTIAQNSGQQQ